MKYFLVEFQAEYYCQGYETATFQRLVKADTFELACDKIKNHITRDWELSTAKDFKNLTIE